MGIRVANIARDVIQHIDDLEKWSTEYAGEMEEAERLADVDTDSALGHAKRAQRFYEFAKRSAAELARDAERVAQVGREHVKWAKRYGDQNMEDLFKTIRRNSRN